MLIHGVNSSILRLVLYYGTPFSRLDVHVVPTHLFLAWHYALYTLTGGPLVMTRLFRAGGGLGYVGIP